MATKYKIIGWPEIQHFMDCPGFDSYCTLITPNKDMGIDVETYLVDKTWYYKYEK